VFESRSFRDSLAHPPPRCGLMRSPTRTDSGSRIRVTQEIGYAIVVSSKLSETTTVHWHGLILPHKMDGPAFITQDPIPMGGSYAYEFTADQAGTFFITAMTIRTVSKVWTLRSFHH